MSLRIWWMRNKPTARQKDCIVLHRRTLYALTTVCGLCLLALVGMLALPALLPLATVHLAPSTHISIPKPLFDIADAECKNNGGYEDVVVKRASDKFVFVCKDGMRREDVLVRVHPHAFKPSGGALPAPGAAPEHL